MMVSKEKLYKYGLRIMVYTWLAILFLCPFGSIASFHDRNPYALGLFIGITMLVYWLTGILTALKKGWRLDK